MKDSERIESQDIDIQEIGSFFETLSWEKSLVRITPEEVLKTSEFIAGVRVDNNLAGIGGIMRRSLFCPELFIVVKSQYQGRGLGKEIITKLINYTKRRYSFLTLITYKSEEYIPAIALYKKNNFKCVNCFNNKLFMYRPFSFKGNLICLFLSLIHIILSSPPGKIFLYLHRVMKHLLPTFKIKDLI